MGLEIGPDASPTNIDGLKKPLGSHARSADNLTPESFGMCLEEWPRYQFQSVSMRAFCPILIPGVAESLPNGNPSRPSV